jgi:hypothetical protein
MVLGRFTGAGKDEDVASLINKKNYSRAIEVIRDQLGKKNDPRLRLQLADVLVSAGKEREAVTILLPLADEFAKEGFAAKAISILKKIQKIDPGRRDIDSRLAGLIQEKQKQAIVISPSPSPGGGFELGIEIGMEAPAAELDLPPIRVAEPEPPPPPRAPAAAPPRPAAPEPELQLEAAPELDLSGGAAPGLGAGTSTGAFDLSVHAEAIPEETPADLGLEMVEEVPPAAAAPAAPAPKAPVAAAPAPPPAPPALAAPVVDQDLFTGEFESVEPVLEPEPEVVLEPEAADPMSDSRFADELFSVLENAFPASPSAPSTSAPGAPAGGAQIVVSPLFKDFSVEELVAVIAGLNLITFERGQVILREGEPGQSLYMLTSGTVKAFVKRDGKQVPIAELEEGAFFGEMSILTGKPRMATIVATEHCELLELDRPTLDAITQSHPHVWDVLQEFATQRTVSKG